MSVDEAALVLVHPVDTIDTIIHKVRNAGATSVELLIPEGIPTLQKRDNCALLRQAVENQHISLLVITSDENTIVAARQSQLETIGFKDVRVETPTKPPGRDGETDTFATQKIGDDVPTVVASGPPPALGIDDAPVRSADEDPFGGGADFDPFAELDSLSAFMDDADRHGVDSMDSASTIDLSKTSQTDANAYDPFAELDDLSATLSGDSSPSRAPATHPETARQRIRPEDIELSNTEKERAAVAKAGVEADNVARGPRQRVRPEDIELSPEEKQRASTARGGRSSASSKRQAGGRSLKERLNEGSPDAAPKRSRRLIWILAAILLVLLVLAAIYLIRSGNSVDAAAMLPIGEQVVITVMLPTPPSETQPFTDLIVPVVDGENSVNDTAIKADVIMATVAFTVSGQSTSETMVPATPARGAVEMFNQGGLGVALPQGTEFIGYNIQGQEVRFTSDVDVYVPPASTVRQFPQIVTTLGQAQVSITARTMGSAGNIEAGTINQIILPDGMPIAVNNGVLVVQHGPITGGSEQPIRIVREEDAYAELGKALTGLNNRARQVLEQQATRQGHTLEVTTIIPRPEMLSQGKGYEQTVFPAIGEPLSPDNPTFQLVVRGPFSALATPAGQLLTQQLQTVVSARLDSTLADGMPFGTGPVINDWDWDGERIVVSGALEPDPNAVAELNAPTRAAIRDSLKGKTPAQARETLENYQQEGYISGYTVPDDIDQIPMWDFLIDLEVVR